MRTLIADPDLLDATVAQLQPGPAHDGGWTRDLSDPASGTVWRLTHLLGELQGGGYRCLMRLPTPTPASLVVLVSESDAADEIWAAAVLLRDHPERLPDLLEGLERAAARADWARVLVALRSSGLVSGLNRRFQIGQFVDQITRDAAHFASLAARSTLLVQRAEAAGHSVERATTDRIKRPWAVV